MASGPGTHWERNCGGWQTGAGTQAIGTLSVFPSSLAGHLHPRAQKMLMFLQGPCPEERDRRPDGAHWACPLCAYISSARTASRAVTENHQGGRRALGCTPAPQSTVPWHSCLPVSSSILPKAPTWGAESWLQQPSRWPLKSGLAFYGNLAESTMDMASATTEGAVVG